LENLIDIRRYSGEFHEINVQGLKRICPLHKVDTEMWIVGNEHLSFGTDIEFTQKAGSDLAKRLEVFESDCILTPEAKSLGITYEVAKGLGHRDYAIARKSVKPYDKNYVSSEIRSITTAKEEKLYLDDLNIKRIRGKRIILLDDVISTGNTMHGLMELAERSQAEVCAIAAVWLEGHWPFEQFAKEFKSGRLVFMGILPIFAEGATYEKLYSKQLYYEKND
jgi:adenine phosphoribosyltransferase